MSDFILLTQDSCPMCERLKMMLRGPLKGEFDDRIEVVHLQSDEARFQELVAQHGIQKTPTLLHAESGRRLLNDQSLHEVKTFLTT